MRMDVEATGNDSDPLHTELNENLSRDTAEDTGPKTDEHENDKVATEGDSCVESEVVAGSENRKITWGCRYGKNRARCAECVAETQKNTQFSRDTSPLFGPIWRFVFG